MLDALGKFKGKPEEVQGTVPRPQPQVATIAHSDPVPESPQTLTSISAGMTLVGKIVGDGHVKIFGRVEGELRASTVLICEGARVEAEVHADDLTIAGHLKGTIHANRVKLNSTAVVEGDIFHRSLAIEENARFEGSSRREDKVIDAKSRLAESQAVS